MSRKMWELIGGALLLISFTIQNFVYDYFDEREKTVRTGMIERAILDRGSQIYEVMFFAANDGGGQLSSTQVAEIRRQFIQQAAIKNSYGLSFPVFVSDMPTAEKQKITAEFGRRAAAVKDLATFSEYIKFSSALSDKVESPNAVLGRISERRELARYIFLALYIVGSASLLIGLAQEKR